MTAPTLAQVFGSNAAQTATTLTITKADLASTGLTASGTNSSESLLVAILLNAQTYLTAANFTANTDQTVEIDSGYSSLTTRGTPAVSYRNDTLTVTLSKLDTSSTINPNDY